MPKPLMFCPHCGSGLLESTIEDRPRKVCADASCGTIQYDNPLPVVAALVQHMPSGDVLLVRNVGWPEKWFGLVSGFLERGESPEAGMLRELEEELGLLGRIVSLIGVYDFAMRNEVIIAYHIEAEGEICVGEELAGYKRVPVEKLRPWPMGTGKAVKDWLAAR